MYSDFNTAYITLVYNILIEMDFYYDLDVFLKCLVGSVQWQKERKKRITDICAICIKFNKQGNSGNMLVWSLMVGFL